MPMANPQRPDWNRSRRSQPQSEYNWQDGWARPDAPQRPDPQRASRRGPLTPEQQRAAARRARERRRRRRRTFFAGTVGGILLLSGIITLLLPRSVTGEPEPAEETPTGSTQLVAPLPYGGSGSSETTAQALNWGSVGPVEQTAEGGYTYTAVPSTPTALPEFGRVDTSWFADAAFLGDSLTAGFCESEYNIDVGGALICGYEGISPNSIVNRTTVKNPDRGEEVALDVLTNAPPPCASIFWTMPLVKTCTARTFRSTICNSLPRSSCAKSPHVPKPALLINRSTRRSRKVSNSPRQASVRERSAERTSQRVGKAAAKSFSRWVRRATSSRSYPCAANWRANSAPMPELAPVITAKAAMTDPLL